MKKRNKNYILAAAVSVLTILSLVSGILASGLLLRVSDDTPRTEFNINIGKGSALRMPSGFSSLKAGGMIYMLDSSAETAKPSNPGAGVYDQDGQWSQNTEIELFLAEYDNEKGDVTVKSAYGDKVIAPGTSYSYYFDIKNTGDTPIYYTVSTETMLSFKVGGNTLTVPIEAKFYNNEGRYLLGSAGSYGEMKKLDGMNSNGGLSVGNYTRFILDWQWPFEGNDSLDTMLGNLAAEGDEARITVKITVTASEDPTASGGSTQTGDSGNAPLWTAICIGSVLMIVMLIATGRRERYEEE